MRFLQFMAKGDWYTIKEIGEEVFNVKRQGASRRVVVELSGDPDDLRIFGPRYAEMLNLFPPKRDR